MSELSAIEQAWIETPQDDYERKFPEISAQNKANALRRYQAFRTLVEAGEWRPTYSPWRHGGSYVDNIVYPSGAVGCIVSARYTRSGRFEIACPPIGYAKTFKTREEAAHAESHLAIEAWEKVLSSSGGTHRI